MSNDQAKGRRVPGFYLNRVGRIMLACILVAVAIWPVGIQPQATQAAPPPPTPIATPKPQPTEPGLSAQGVTPPSPDNLLPEMEQARARQAMEAVLAKYLRYWGPRYQVAPIEVAVEGEWAHGVAQWQGEAKTLSGPIHILAHRSTDGTWQALLPGSDGLYQQWIDAMPESLVPAGEKSQLRMQAAEADVLRRPQATPAVPAAATAMPPGKEEPGEPIEPVPGLMQPTARPTPVVGPAQPPSDGPYLFTDSAIEGVLDTSDDPTIVRTRFVNINFDMMGGADGLQGDESEISNVVVLNLFEDVVFTAILDRVGPNRSGGYFWIGHLEGVEHSQVILVVKDRLMAGNITLRGAFYQVRYASNGVHAIYEIDQSAFPSEAEPISVDTSDEVEAPGTAMADDGSTIDVLVVYTGAARSAAGGTTAMETLINLAVAETNQSYANSLITQRLNLVHTAEVTYSESGFNWITTLNRLTEPSDGYMDNVHTLRDTYYADEVVLIVNDTVSCGIAWLMTAVSHDFEDHAFAVVARTCATGYYSFGHELGHNMGARHDWYVDSHTTPYAYAHGYVNVADEWRTIMAYNTECSPGYCTRFQYWSNPDVYYGGDPMGVPEGSYHAADNRKTLNNTAYTVANWRESSGPPPPQVKLFSLANYQGSVVFSGGTGFSNDPNADSYSMEIPSGWSVKTWRGDNRSGEERCWSESVPNLQDHGWHLAIQSIEVFDHDECRLPGQVKLWSLANYQGSVMFSGGTGFSNDPNADSYSMEIPSGWSVKTWRGDNRSGEERCWSESVPNLQDHGWHLAIQSIEIFDSNVCGQVKLWSLANYQGSTVFSGGTGFSNEPDADSYSMEIPSGWSVYTWRGDNRSGEERCWPQSVPNLQDHGWHLAIQSIEAFDHNICPPAPPSLQSPGNGSTFNEGDEITLYWSATGDEYYGEVWDGPGGTLTFGWQSGTSKGIGSQPAGYTYSWHVKARNTADESDWSSIWTFTVKPAAPSNLSAQAVSCSQINLTWDDNSGNEEGYRIYRNGSYAGQVGMNTTSYQDTGLSEDTTYSYYVKAFRGSIESDASNTVNVSTGPCLTGPDLVPAQWGGWQYPIVPSSITDTTVVNTLYAGYPTYIDWGLANNGDTNTGGNTYGDLYIDSTRYAHYDFGDVLAGQSWAFFDWTETVDTPGWHTLKVVVDPENLIDDELDETNNVWEHQFYWEPSCNDQNEPNDTPSDATFLSFGQTRSANICGLGDYDYYRFTGTAGQKIVVDIDAEVDGSLLDSYLSLFDSDGTTILAEHDDEILGERLDSHLAYELLHNGTYYIRVRDWDHPNVGGTDYFYTIHLLTDNTNPSSAEITSPDNNAWIDPSLETVTVSASDDESGISHVDFLWHDADWENSDWVWLGIDWDGRDGWSWDFDTSGLAEQRGGAFYIWAFDWAGNWTGAGTWNMGIDRTPPTASADVSPMYGDAPFLDFYVWWWAWDNLSDIASYDIQYRDGSGGTWTNLLTDTTDTYYRFVGQDGHTYYFRVRARDLTGNQSAYASGDGDVQHTVQICATSADAYEPDNSYTVAETITTDGTWQSHNFHIDGDQDWVEFTATAGITYTLVTTNTGGHADTVLDLYESDGSTLIDSNDDDPDNWPASRLEWGATRGGTYYVQVEHWDPYAYGCTTVYGLSIAETGTFEVSNGVFLPIILKNAR